MPISQHEKEIIDYAASQLFLTLTRANPFPIDAPDKISNNLSLAIDMAAHNMSIAITENLKQINEQNRKFQEELHRQNLVFRAEIAKQSAQDAAKTRRIAIFTAGPLAIAVALLADPIKWVFKLFLQ